MMRRAFSFGADAVYAGQPPYSLRVRNNEFGKLEVLDLYVYRIGLATSDYSYAIAIGMLKTVISIIMLFTVNGFSKRIRGSTII